MMVQNDGGGLGFMKVGVCGTHLVRAQQLRSIWVDEDIDLHCSGLR